MTTGSTVGPTSTRRMLTTKRVDTKKRPGDVMIHALGLFILYIPNLTCSLLYNLASLAVRELVDNDALANAIGVESLAVNGI